MQAVLDEPDNDAPRLAFADGLAAQGNLTRAEFIRVQIERATLADDHPRQSELEAAEWRLLSEHGLRWLDPPPRSVILGEYRRGFFEVLGTTASRWLLHRQQFLESGQFPIRVLRLCMITQLSQAEVIARLREVHAPEVIIENEIRDARVAADTFLPALAQLPELARLSGLEFSSLSEDYGAISTEITDAQLAPFLATPALHGLESLGLAECEISAQTLEVLSAPSWSRLRALDFSSASNYVSQRTAGPPFSPENLQNFSRSATWQNLHKLRLTCACVPEMSVAQWAGVLGAGQLRDLDIYGVDDVATIIEGLTQTPATWQKLRCAGGRMNDGLPLPIDEAAIALLINSPCVANLQVLDLGGTTLSRAGFREICRSPHLTNLRELYLGTSVLDRDALAELFRASFAENLIGLGLGYGNDSDDHILALAKSKRLRQLRHLSIWERNLRESTVLALLSSPSLPNLTRLRLGRFEFTNAIVNLLLQPPRMPHLAWLDVWANRQNQLVESSKLAELLHCQKYAHINNNEWDSNKDLKQDWQRFASWRFFQREQPEYA